LIRLVRGLIGLALIAAVVWCSFRVRLGQRTFAEHADRIGETPEAREMLDGARNTVTPVLQDATDRMLGEYVEAPTDTAPPARVPARERVVPASARSADDGRLPGR
jgi:hypothetical protein